MPYCFYTVLKCGICDYLVTVLGNHMQMNTRVVLARNCRSYKSWIYDKLDKKSRQHSVYIVLVADANIAKSVDDGRVHHTGLSCISLPIIVMSDATSKQLKHATHIVIATPPGIVAQKNLPSVIKMCGDVKPSQPRKLYVLRHGTPCTHTDMLSISAMCNVSHENVVSRLQTEPIAHHYAPKFECHYVKGHDAQNQHIDSHVQHAMCRIGATLSHRSKDVTPESRRLMNNVVNAALASYYDYDANAKRIQELMRLHHIDVENVMPASHSSRDLSQMLDTLYNMDNHRSIVIIGQEMSGNISCRTPYVFNLAKDGRHVDEFAFHVHARDACVLLITPQQLKRFAETVMSTSFTHMYVLAGAIMSDPHFNALCKHVCRVCGCNATFYTGKSQLEKSLYETIRPAVRKEYLKQTRKIQTIGSHVSSKPTKPLDMTDKHLLQLFKK
jgi:hypothetical protein